MADDPSAAAASLAEGLARAFDRMLAIPEPVASSGESTVHGRTVSGVVQISTEMAMDYGLIPDDRPPFVPTRRQRFRWWRQERVRRSRMRLASRIAGFDVDERW